MRKVLHTFTLVLAAQTAAASTDVTLAAAQDKRRWFQADMVVFLNEGSMASGNQPGSEKWPGIKSHLLPTDAIKLKPAFASGGADQSVNLNEWLSEGQTAQETVDLEIDAYVDLPYSSQLLQKQGNALERRQGYRILQRTAWLMPVREGESTPPVAVQSFNLSTQGNSMLEGTVTVNSSRFMHVAVNLWYSELVPESLSGMFSQTTPERSEENKGEPIVGQDIQMVQLPDGQPMRISGNFQLQESRRIQNIEEIQYLDSPVIGVLFKLTPYEWPEQQLLPEREPGLEPKREIGVLPGIVLPDES